LLSARVDAAGSFEFTHVLPGNYTARMPHTIALVQPSPKVSVKVSGKDVTGVQIALPPLKEIPGNVTVEKGDPIPQLRFTVSGGFGRATGVVAAYTRDFSLFLPEGDGRIVLETASLPKGYTLRSLNYGSFDLIKNPRVKITAINPAELRAVIAVTTATVAISLPDGRPIHTGLPESNASVTVRGRVTGIERGNPPMHLHLLSGPGRPLEGGVPARQDGPFELVNVLQGHYMLEAQTIGGPTGPMFALYRSIAVAEKDINDVEIVIPRLKTVFGRMVVERDGPMPGTYMFGVDLGGGAPMAVSIRPACDGSFMVWLPEGDHRVSPGLPQSYLKAFTYGSTDLLRDRLQVSSGDNAELQITLAANSTTSQSASNVGAIVISDKTRRTSLAIRSAADARSRCPGKAGPG
jgi:hypothetical protein